MSSFSSGGELLLLFTYQMLGPDISHAVQCAIKNQAVEGIPCRAKVAFRGQPSDCKGCVSSSVEVRQYSQRWGQSQPSVSSILLHSTLYLPASKSRSTSARSPLSPFTSAARKPLLSRISRNFCDVFISGKEHNRFTIHAILRHFVGYLTQIRL